MNTLIAPRAADRSPVGCRLIVLAKEPIAGRVKTRLTPPYTPDQAAELATAALADTLAAVLSAVSKADALGYTVEPVLVLDGAAGSWLEGLVEGPFEMPVIAQRSGGLDARIAGAFHDAYTPEASLLLVGMDTPQLTARMLARAIDTLARPGCGAVLGMADDGGWWGMGLRRPDADLVLGVPMSTSETGQAQYSRLVSSGLSVSLLNQLRDVDLAADADAAAELAPRGRFAATLARHKRHLASADR